MQLTKDWNEFQKEIRTLILAGNELAQKELATIRDDKSFDSVKIEIKNWGEKCYIYLSESFDDIEKEFANGFRQKQNEGFYIPGVQKNISQVIKDEFSELKSKTKTLDYYLRILSVSDAIIKHKETNIKLRSKYSTEDIIELLLDKLYDLYDNSYYSVDSVFEGNGITLSRYGEDRQIVNLLSDQGYVNTTKISIVDAQLTLEGKLYVEEKRKKKKATYNNIGNSKEEVSKKIDELINRLNNLGLGQEILFDELQELKGLYEQLNKTNWGQLLKGKLIDLALIQVINKDTMKFVYEFITKDILSLT